MKKNNPAIKKVFHEGLNLAREGEHARAAKCYERVLEMDPAHERAMYNLGVALFRLGKYNDSADRFRDLMAYRPNDPDVYVNFGRILDGGGKPDQAMVCFTKALELEPGHAEAHCRVGILLGRDQGRYKEAIESFRRALEIAGPLADAHQGIAICLHHLGDHQAAIDNIKTAIMLDPGNGSLHNHLGIMYLKIGEETRADEHFRRALELNPNLKLKHQNLWDMG